MHHTSLTVPDVTAPADRRLQNCNGAGRGWSRLAAVLLVAVTALVARADATSPFITTFAGGGASNADGVAATDAHLEQPGGIAVDRDGHVFFADSYTYTIRRVDGTTGLITTVAGGGEECLTASDPCGDDGPATAASFVAPLDVAVDAAGNLFIADTWHHRIRRVDAATGIVTTVAGSGNGDPFVPPGDGGPATEAVLNYPESVAVDAGGNLYIADTVHRLVRRVDAASGIITTIIGNDTLSWPRQVALDAEDHLFVMDASGTGNRVYRIDTLTLDDLTLIAGTDSAGGDGSSGQATDAFLGAGNGADVAPDGLGGLYVANTLRVWRVDLATGEISHVAGSDPWCYMTGAETCGDGGPADVARFSNIHGIAASGDGTLYISDEGNQRVRWIAGPGGPGPDPDPVPTAVLTVPAMLAFGEDLVASAAGSTDADGTIVRYTWQLDAAPPVVTDVPTHAFPAPSPGSHTVTLFVTDDAGNVSAPVSAAVEVGPDQVPTAVLTVPAMLAFGQPLVASAAGSTDADGTIVRYTWQLDAAPPVVTDVPTHAFPAPSPGSHTVTLFVTDDAGNVSAPVSAGVVVEADQVPTAVLTVPATLPAGQPLVASAAGSTDADGTIVRYTWQLDAAPPVATDVPTHAFPAPSPGSHTVTLFVTDDAGNVSAPVSAGVVVEADQAPTAVLTVPATRAFGEDLVASAAGSTDIDGLIVQYRWQLDAGPPVVTSVPSHTFPAPSPGTHTVMLAVVDDGGNLSAPAVATVVVEVAPTVPTLTCGGFDRPLIMDDPATPLVEMLVLGPRERRVVPVRVLLLDAAGAPVTDATIPPGADGTRRAPVIRVVFRSDRGRVVVVDDLNGDGSPERNRAFRYDAASGRWIFNMPTAGLQPRGTYTIVVRSGDRNAFRVDRSSCSIAIRKN